ncbi:hypothetical protein [Eleftheria terrae]|uniref:hypothetical protein n=1 Tax=Eleftheria terrae TaxID=1597781 RepID=UPI00263B82CE|nr:hypothetical protein [Eleftheria terrae]WKB53011.1 hypothetical protein N7L95_00990 [Eleftheria terrae]
MTKTTRNVQVPGDTSPPESNKPDQPNDLIDPRVPPSVQEEQRREHTSDSRHKGDSVEALQAQVDALRAENQRLKSAASGAPVPAVLSREVPKAADINPAELTAPVKTDKGWIVPEPPATVTTTVRK